MGTTELNTGHFTDDPDGKLLRVVYAWPRRPQERESTRESPEQPLAAGVNDDPTVNRAIAEHYFPDLYTHPTEWPRADPWVLLDRQGKVLTTGRRVVMSGWDIKLYVESLYPGIRTEEIQITTVHGGPGQSADVGFLWLATDSPISDLSRADLSARDALLVYADVIGEGMTRPTVLTALKVGSPGLTVCSLRNPFGVVRVEITALDIAADAVTAPESTVVRAPYGGSTALQLTDQNRKVWKIVLHPERITSL